MATRWRLILVLACVLLIASPGLLVAAPSTQQPATIRVGVGPSGAAGGLYTAHASGYFSEEGLDVDVVPIDQVGTAATALSTGQLEMAITPVGPGLINMIGRGLPVTIVAGVLHQNIEDRVGLAVRTSLIDDGRVRDYADLRGLRIGVSGLGSSSGAQLVRALRLGGLTLSDVDVRELPFPSLLAALTNGALDAALLINPYIEQAVQSGVAVLWRRTGDYALGQQVSTLVANTDFVQRQPDAIARFIYAYLRGTREYLAVMHGNGDPAPYYRILAQYISVPDPSVFATQSPAFSLDPNGTIDRASLEEDQEIFLSMGQLTARVDLGRAIEEQYLRAALARLESEH